MSSLHIIENVRKTNNSALTGLVLKHQVEEERTRTVENLNSNGVPLSTTATSSRAKISMTSSTEGKSVVSSVSMSMERKDSVQYLPRKIPQCVIPAGQSTVIHLDNYTQFMSHRVTSYKRAAIISEEHKPIIVPTTSNKSVGVVDLDLKDIINSVNSSHHSNNKTSEMNKQKLLGSKSITPSKIRERKNSLFALENRKPIEGNKMIDMEANKPDTSAALKQNKSKKLKIIRRKKVNKPRKTRKSKIKTKTGGGANTNDEDKEVAEELQSVSSNEPPTPTRRSKILRPCVYTLQSIKCLFEMTCPYLHSDFPCKYYYLNLLCPKGFKCQFMHNGPLKPKLIEALRNHILDLLSPKPSVVETHFVQQMYNIEDLLQKLQSFRNNQNQNNEIIEVFDDDDNDDNVNQELVAVTSGIDNFNNKVKALNETNTSTAINSTTNKLDIVYKNFKESNSIIDEVDKKLKNLKNKPNMTPNQKIYELENIYDILKEQEKILPIYKNLNTPKTKITTANTTEKIKASDNSENASYPLVTTTIENQPLHIDIDNSDVINDNRIQNPTYKETRVALTNDDNTTAITKYNGLEETNSNVSQVNGIVFPSLEVGIEVLPQFASSGDNESPSSAKDSEANDLNESLNLIYEQEEPETILDNSNSMVKESYEKAKPVITDCNNPFEYDSHQSFDKNMPTAFDKNQKINEKLPLHNEMFQLDIKNCQKEFIENNINDMIDDQTQLYEDIGKPIKRDRIRLRSHTLQRSYEENTNANNIDRENTKPIKTRRLRLPKPSQKSIEKSDTNECQINADVINKLIKSTENNENREQIHKEDLELPLTQNILTKGYLKRAKAKLQQSNEIETTVGNNNEALHSGSTKNLNSNDVSSPTQTLEDSNFSTHSQDSLTVNGDCDNVKEINNDMPTSSQNVDTKKLAKKYNKSFSKNVKLSFENPTSSLALSLPPSAIKGKFNLGNPHVVLTKLRTRFLPTTQKDVQADSTTSYVNPIVTSSTLLADDKSTHKRHSFTSEYDLDSSLKGNKCLKIDHSKSVSTVEAENRIRKHSEQSINSSSDDNDFESDSCGEKLTIVDAFQTSSDSNNEQSQEVSESSSTHTASQQQHHSHQHELEEQENKYDLRQQIENSCNTSNSQLQKEQQDDEIEKLSLTTVSFETKNSNNSQHKEYQKQENELGLEERDDEKEMEVINYKKSEQIANTYDKSKECKDEHECTQCFIRIDEPEELASISCNKYSNGNEIGLMEKKINAEYSTLPSLFNKFSKYSTTCEINLENSSVNITPISPPTDGDNNIASPPSFSKFIDIRMGGEIDGRLTYPPIPYILHEIDLEKTATKKALSIDSLKKPIQLDPRVFRTEAKKQIMTFCKPVETISPIASPNTLKYSHNPSLYGQPIASMIASSDPRSRTSAVIPDIAIPSLPHQTALTPYNNSLQTVATTSPSSSFMCTGGIPNSIPLALQYHSTPQPIIQPQQQQTPNMFLYGCLQRSPWYQSLMSTVKIQINQSISQLVRALNNFHRERLLNPELLFDVFKIDCAGELLEIMRNLGVFVDANGVINEQRHVASFGGRPCCSTTPVNATYSFIQQVLTPNTHCTSLTTASSTYNAAAGTPVCQLNINEPFVSCYIKAPAPAEDSATTNISPHDDNNNNQNHNNNNRNDYNTNNYNTQNDNRRYGGNQFRKPYGKNSGSNNNYQQRSNQRYNNYNNNPRFMKPGSCSPTKLNSSPPTSPRKDEGGNGGSNGGGRGGTGGRINNNRRFNNYNNGNKKNATSLWSSSTDSNDNRYNNKYQYCSPPRNSSPNPSYKSESPKTSSPPPQASSKNDANDEECWDSDN